MSANTSKWYMSDEEIMRSYRCCENATAQIGILAELNCKTKAEVKKKLSELGIEFARTAGRPTRYTQEERHRIYTLRHDELRPYSAIARIIGKSTAESVRNEYRIMHRERLRARPLIEKAVESYIKQKKTTQYETDLLRELIQFGI